MDTKPQVPLSPWLFHPLKWARWVLLAGAVVSVGGLGYVIVDHPSVWGVLKALGIMSLWISMTASSWKAVRRNEALRAETATPTH
jgi:hypothetical protein